MSGAAGIFGPRLGRAVVVLSALSLVATLTAILFGQKLSTPRALPRDSYTYGELGHRAFVETLEALGFHVLRGRRDNLSAHRSPVFFIEPDAPSVRFEGQPFVLADVVSERADAGLDSVVVLPKWTWSEAPPRVATIDEPAIAALLEPLLPGATLVHRKPFERSRGHELEGALGRYAASLPRLQLLKLPEKLSDGDEVLLGNKDAAAIIRRYDDVLIVSDPDLLHSWSLAHADHAAIWVDLLREELLTDTLVVDEVFHGHGRKLSLGQAMGELPAAFFTAQVLVVFVLLVLAGARRFGPALAERRLGHGPAESIDVAAFVLAEGKPIAELGRAYVEEVIDDLAIRLRIDTERSLEARAMRIDQLAKRRGKTVDAIALLTEAAELESQKRPGAGHVLALARRAHAMRTEILRTHRG